MGVYRVDKLVAEACKLAAEYRRTTGKTLAVSGEIAVSDAINLLDLDPAPNEAQGYDATRLKAGEIEKLQIKGRAIFDDRRRPGRLGQLKLDQAWDLTVLVLMDGEYEAFELIEASRADIEASLAEQKPNRRGSISVARFRIIGHTVWTREGGIEPRDA